jgi:glycosyltransferase involved in cell wall biosynthesis
MSTTDLSVIVPLYNEEESLPHLVPELRDVLMTLGRSFEIICIDDGSADRSFQILLELQARFPEVRIIKLSGRSGQTAAMDAGFHRSHGRILVTMDADLQNDPADIPTLLAELTGFDMVIGWRIRRNDTWLRLLESRIANWFRSRVTGDRVHDIGCSLKVYRREILERIRLYQGMHRFLPILCEMEGGRVKEVPVNHRPRKFGQSKYGIQNRLWRGLYDLMAVRWMQNRRLKYKIEKEC